MTVFSCHNKQSRRYRNGHSPDHPLVHLLFPLAVAVLLLWNVSAAASTYLELNDEAYPLLERLEAEGVIKSGLLTTKPISRKEAVRLLNEAEENSRDRNEFIKSLVRDLYDRVRPETAGPHRFQLLDSVYARYINTNADVETLPYLKAREKEQALNVNNDGDLYGHGSNGRVGFISRVEDVGRFSLFVNPEFNISQGSGSDLTIKNGYAVFDFGWDLVAGRGSQWWGPGYHGALLVSNNAEPLTMVKVANPGPVVLPWIFKYLGPFHFDLFASKLEKDRADVSEPYLWGMRVNIKPHPNLELGLERTSLTGGQGRPTTWQTWFNSFTGRHEHCSDPQGCYYKSSDQRAGYDLKLTLPFEVQPLQVYMEADGEDSYGNYNLPRYWAYLYGMYLPRVLSLERLEFRLEWARTFDRRADKPTTWYLNDIYTSGYTYHGLIIGHHMGTDSRDLFAEFTIRAPEKSASLSLALERIEHALSESVSEIDQEVSLRGRAELTQSLEVDLTLGYVSIHNADLVQGSVQRSYLSSGTLTRRF